LDTDNAQHYQANAARLNEKLEHLHQTLTTKLASVTTQPFLVFHDAYHYFEKRYNLHAVGSIAISPESQPSAKRILELRQRIQAQQVACVFGESQFASPILNTLLANTTAKSGQLDPIGATLPATTASYFTLLHNLSDAFLHCLQSKD
jgi:zinc transport system substrate-binding protein